MWKEVRERDPVPHPIVQALITPVGAHRSRHCDKWEGRQSRSEQLCENLRKPLVCVKRKSRDPSSTCAVIFRLQILIILLLTPTPVALSVSHTHVRSLYLIPILGSDRGTHHGLGMCQLDGLVPGNADGENYSVGAMLCMSGQMGVRPSLPYRRAVSRPPDKTVLEQASHPHIRSGL